MIVYCVNGMQLSLAIINNHNNNKTIVTLFLQSSKKCVGENQWLILQDSNSPACLSVESRV